MGFSSIDDFISEVSTYGKFNRVDWAKGLTGLGTVVAGRWYDTTIFPGNPPNWVHGNYVFNYDFTAGGSGWTFAGAWTWTQATHLLTRTASAADTTVTQNTACESGVTYRVTYTMARSAGTLTPSLGGTNLTARSAAGTYYQDIACGATASAPLVFTADSSFAGTIDLVSIQRLKDWTPYIATTGKIGSEYAVYSGGDTGAETKHIINAGVWAAGALSAPCVVMVVDLLGTYPGLAFPTTSALTLTQGTNFIANGTFTGNANGWTTGAGWTYNSNAVDKGAGAAALSQTPAIAAIAGMTYEITYTISGYSVGGVLTIGYGGGTTTRTIAADGTYKDLVVATGAGDITFTTVDAARYTIDTVTAYYGIPRYSDGNGVKAFTTVQSTPGAMVSSYFSLGYTNTVGTNGAGTASRGLGCAVMMQTAPIIGHMNHSGQAASQFGPFLPLQGGDTGIRSVQSTQLSVAGATADSTYNLVLCKPLFSIPINTVGAGVERDFMNQLPSLPRLKDGAVLGFLVFAGAVIPAAATYTGNIDVAWS
jgi:hypothetical protein